MTSIRPQACREHAALRRALALLALLAALTAAALAPAPALAQTDSAQVENRQSGTSVLDFAFAVRRVGGDTVDQTNVATAYSSCDTCQTVAIAIQVVLVTAGNPSVVNPTNVAVTVNEGCTSCAGFAAAYQFVVGRGGPVRLTGEGQRELARVQRALAELRRRFERGELTVADVKLAVVELTDQVKRVLDEELVPVGGGGSDGGSGTPDLDDRGRPRGEGEPVPLPPGLEDESPGEGGPPPSAPGEDGAPGEGVPPPTEPGAPAPEGIPQEGAETPSSTGEQP